MKEVANVAMFLVETPAINGQILSVDGGMGAICTTR
jgi:enoyl-[acyl-carrier-protein] reductase (NADH)